MTLSSHVQSHEAKVGIISDYFVFEDKLFLHLHKYVQY